MTELIAAFRGSVSCQLQEGPLGLTLAGATAAHPQDQTTLQFTGAAPAQLPVALEDARVEALGDGRFRIACGERAWLLSARAVHLHRGVAREFYGAIPPRPVPPGKRLFWRLVLALAASRAGLFVLRSLRR